MPGFVLIALFIGVVTDIGFEADGVVRCNALMFKHGR